MGKKYLRACVLNTPLLRAMYDYIVHSCVCVCVCACVCVSTPGDSAPQRDGMWALRIGGSASHLRINKIALLSSSPFEKHSISSLTNTQTPLQLLTATTEDPNLWVMTLV